MVKAAQPRFESLIILALKYIDSYKRIFGNEEFEILSNYQTIILATHSQLKGQTLTKYEYEYLKGKCEGYCEFVIELINFNVVKLSTQDETVENYELFNNLKTITTLN
jgi:hypothetical protein